MRLLFIGNSFTARNDVPRLVAALAAGALPAAVETRMIVAGGASLSRHWNGPLAQGALADRWDAVVLQEQSTLPLKNPARYHQNVRTFDAAIRATGARTVLYMTWARREAETGAGAILAATVEEIGGELGAFVVPAGRVFHAAHDAGLDPYDRDGSHPNGLGSYTAASAFVTSLFGRKPADERVAAGLGIPAEVAQRIHDLAWSLRAAPPLLD